jgi:hypothetical protein
VALRSPAAAGNGQTKSSSSSPARRTVDLSELGAGGGSSVVPEMPSPSTLVHPPAPVPPPVSGSPAPPSPKNQPSQR